MTAAEKARGKELRQAARGDMAARARYEDLAARAETPEQRRYWLAAAKECRRSAAENLREAREVEGYYRRFQRRPKDGADYGAASDVDGSGR